MADQPDPTPPDDGDDGPPAPEHTTVSLSSTPGGTSAQVIIPAEGTILGGKYRVEGLLGEGGMGVVLAAAHVKLGRSVALKLMRRGVQADRQALRLVREARAAGSLKSPYVAELIDVEELPDGTPFLVLERLEGETLAERLRRGPLPVAEAADVLAQAALGVAAAHAAGVVHRDVKPSNLFLVPGAGGRRGVKVIDFGVAKSADPHDVTLTAEASMLGSPLYMSPEQTRGARHADARSDVWSLGVTLFEALTGELPFPGKSAQAVAAAVAADAPRSLEALRPELPRGVLRLVASCLEKDPARRCPSAPAFVRALAPHAGAAGSALLEEARALDAGPPVAGARRRASAIALAAAALAALGFAANARRARPPPPASAASSAPAAPRPFAPASPRRLTFDEGCEEFPTWSNDGRAILYDGASGRDTRVFTLDVASGARRPLTSGAGWQMAPAISPRGDLIAYLVMSSSADGVYVAAPDGSSPRRVSPVPVVRPAFSPDGAFVWAGAAHKPERIDVTSGSTVRALVPPDAALVISLIELADGRVIARADTTNDAGGLVLFAAGQDRGAWLWRGELEETLEIAPDGAAAIVARQTESQVTEPWRVPLDGSPAERLPLGSLHPTKGLRVSPDGARVAWSNCRSLEHLARAAPGPALDRLVLEPQARTNDWLDQVPSAVRGTSQVLLLSTRAGSLRPCLVDLEEREPTRCLDVGALVPADPTPSPDGKQYVFTVPGQGFFVGPLDGSSAPRRLVELPAGDVYGQAAFTPDGAEVAFTHAAAHQKPTIDRVAVAGGPPRRFVDASAQMLVFSPRGDRAAFLQGTDRPVLRPMVLDLATQKAHPLAADLPDDNYLRVRWSASGARVGLLRSGNEVIEVDAATGKVTRRLDAGNDEITGFTYVGEELWVTHATWIGDVWVAELR